MSTVVGIERTEVKTEAKPTLNEQNKRKEERIDEKIDDSARAKKQKIDDNMCMVCEKPIQILCTLYQTCSCRQKICQICVEKMISFGNTKCLICKKNWAIVQQPQKPYFIVDAVQLKELDDIHGDMKCTDKDCIWTGKRGYFISTHLPNECCGRNVICSTCNTDVIVKNHYYHCSMCTMLVSSCNINHIMECLKVDVSGGVKITYKVWFRCEICKNDIHFNQQADSYQHALRRVIIGHAKSFHKMKSDKWLL